MDPTTIDRKLRIAIRAMLREVGEHGMTTSEVSKAMGMKYETVQRVLISMRSNDEVAHGNRGGSWRCK